MLGPDGILSQLQRSLYGVQLALWQKFALFVVVSSTFAVVTIWLRTIIEGIGPAGYVVAFLISVAGAATVIVPAPTFAIVVIVAEDLNVFLLGIAAGIGGTIGELSGYWLGTQCRLAIQDSWLDRATKKAMARFGGGVLFVSGLLPVIPVDVAGLIAGATAYPVRRFLFWLALGKVPMNIGLLYLSVEAIDRS